MSTTLVHFFTPFPLCVDVIYGSPLPRPTCGGTSEGHTNCGGGKRRRRQARQCHLLQGRFLYPQGNSTISPNHHLNDGWNRLHSAPHHHTHNSKFKTENATCRNIRKSQSFSQHCCFAGMGQVLPWWILQRRKRSLSWRRIS